jgi:hypothetical protein
MQIVTTMLHPYTIVVNLAFQLVKTVTLRINPIRCIRCNQVPTKYRHRLRPARSAPRMAQIQTVKTITIITQIMPLIQIVNTHRRLHSRHLNLILKRHQPQQQQQQQQPHYHNRFQIKRIHNASWACTNATSNITSIIIGVKRFGTRMNIK